MQSKGYSGLIYVGLSERRSHFRAGAAEPARAHLDGLDFIGPSGNHSFLYRAGVTAEYARRRAWLSQCAGFRGKAMNRCRLPIAESFRPMVVGASLPSGIPSFRT